MALLVVGFAQRGSSIARLSSLGQPTDLNSPLSFLSRVRDTTPARRMNQRSPHFFHMFNPAHQTKKKYPGLYRAPTPIPSGGSPASVSQAHSALFITISLTRPPPLTTEEHAHPHRQSLDGTLVDSTAAVEGAWATFKERYPYIDVPTILKTAHGVRSIDNMRNWIFPPGTPEPILQAEADKFEVEIVNSANHGKQQGKHGIVFLPGAKEILAVARSSGDEWAICTSVPLPKAFVTAGDVTKGKPWPEPYLLGAAKCGVDPAECVVFEDAPSGIMAGKAAGCKVIALLTSHTREAVEAAQPDVIVENLSQVSASWDGEKFSLAIA
ncbi:HAD-superfamily hydrolase, subfamily IA, variant 3 [Rhizoctonia solani]|uniref:HAD-superfamily hydrolase, subfamily IA, variant 3 n=1 Tax=Rhizoctonia solani TaxID=456999 RepID=A0A0K6FW73_9AGAM|nr:HAD-superfamily hydrolase, subfamily IA, variant 3 [Rhizoctonia solani]